MAKTSTHVIPMLNRVRQRIVQSLISSEQKAMLDKRVSQSIVNKQYRPLTQRVNDLPATDYREVQKLCSYLRKKNGAAKRCIEMIADFCLSDGISFRTFNNPILEERLQKHWKDEINRWDRKQHERVEQLFGMGEQLWPINIGADGIIRLGNVAPVNIEKVYVSDFDTTIPLEVHVREAGSSKIKRYGIVRRSFETGRFEQLEIKDGNIFTGQFAASLDNNQTLDGIAFFWRLNLDAEQSRGIPELYAAADWLDGLDFILTQAVTRTAIVNKVVWDVTIESNNADDIQKRALEIAEEQPTAVQTRVHGTNETWKVITPDLKANDIAELSRLVQNNGLGAMGVPEHWFVQGASENLATAREMSTPVFRRLKRKQAFVSEMIRTVLEYQRDVLIDRGIIQDLGPDKMRIEMVVPNITQPSAKENAELLEILSRVLLIAEQQGWIGNETSKMLIHKYVSELGVIVDENTLTDGDEDDGNESEKPDDSYDDDADATAKGDVVAVEQAMNRMVPRRKRKSKTTSY